MNFPLAHHDPADEETAALWAARLDGGKLAASAQREFEAWLAGHPARRALISEYTQFAVDTAVLVRALVDEDRVPAPPPPSRRTTDSHRWWPALALGGLVAATAALVVFFHSPATKAGPLEYATAPAQRHGLSLADGTQIELSARTRVSIELGTAERRVRLSSGQAFFSVAQDKSKPFTVETPAGSVLVTGTRFAVATEDDRHLTVTVAEGTVLVTPLSGVSPISITSGQKLSSEGAAVSVEALPADALANELAWRDGHVVFASTPLPEALASYARYHNRTIVTDSSLQELRVGGRYNLDDLDGFLGALQEIFPLRIEQAADGSLSATRRLHN